MSYFRVNGKCNGCLACVENCPASALRFSDRDNRRTLKHNMTKCARCGQCWRICPQKAIEFEHLLEGGWDDVVTLDLIRCQVCSEPLYSTVYLQKMAGELNSTGEALCPLHRQRQAASKLPVVVPGRTFAKSGYK
ncbi:MAG: 4Fe-4S dicluster domain-containing protein [Desulfobacterales bacterium]|jgi:ferredoxin hydrogenase large subunit